LEVVVGLLENEARQEDNLATLKTGRFYQKVRPTEKLTQLIC